MLVTAFLYSKQTIRAMGHMPIHVAVQLARLEEKPKLQVAVRYYYPAQDNYHHHSILIVESWIGDRMKIRFCNSETDSQAIDGATKPLSVHRQAHRKAWREQRHDPVAM